MKPTDAELIRAAFKARSFAYTPYSHFKVGAALLAMSLIVTFWDGNRFYNPFV